MVEVIASLAVFMISKALYLSAMAYFFIIHILKMLWRISTSETKQAATTEPIAVHVNPVIVRNDESAVMRDPIGEFLSNFKAAQIRVIPLENIGSLTLSIYQVDGMSKRSLLITNPALVKRLGFDQKKLEDLRSPATMKESERCDYFYQQSIQDVQLYLNSQLAGSVEKTETIRGTDKATEVPKSNPIIVQKEVAQIEVKPIVSAPIVVRDANKVKQNKASRIGRFVGTGMGERSKTDPITKEKSQYKQFFVEFYDEALDGNLSREYGADLERVVDLVKPQVGQRIRITNLGRTPINFDGDTKKEPQYRNNFDLVLL
jgi:hypothetical protein